MEQDDLADAGTGLETAVGLGGPVEGVGPVDHRWRHVVLGHERHEAGHVARTAHRGPDQLELAKVVGPDVERRLRGHRRAKDHQPTAWSHTAQGLRPAADAVEYQVEPLVAG